MANKITEQIESLEERLKKLKNRRQKLNARHRSQQSLRDRREETRRKILVGAIVLAKVEQGVLDRATLISWLNGALTREDDRALFKLTRENLPTGAPR